MASNDIHNESDDEVIPPAPAFCQRFSPEEAERITKKLTADSMLQLGAKIQSDINFHKENNKRSNLKELGDTVRLSDMLHEYFELDITGQKARMLDLFTEMERIRKSNTQFKSAVDRIQKEYQEEKENREELSDQCDAYIEEIDEKDEDIKKNTTEINGKNLEIEKMRMTIECMRKRSGVSKRYYRVRLFVLGFITTALMAFNLNNLFY